MAKGRNQYRSYTLAERTEALTKLALNGGNSQKTARDTGIPLTTIITWKNTYFSEYAGIEKKQIDNILKETWKGIKKLIDSDLIADLILAAKKKGNLREVISAASVLIDKALLLSGVKASLSTLGRPVEADANDIDSEKEVQELIKEEEAKEKRRKENRIVK